MDLRFRLLKKVGLLVDSCRLSLQRLLEHFHRFQAMTILLEVDHFLRLLGEEPFRPKVQLALCDYENDERQEEESEKSIIPRLLERRGYACEKNILWHHLVGPFFPIFEAVYFGVNKKQLYVSPHSQVLIVG